MSGSPCTRYLFVFRKPHEIMRLQAPRFQTQPLNRADPSTTSVHYEDSNEHRRGLLPTVVSGLPVGPPSTDRAKQVVAYSCLQVLSGHTFPDAQSRVDLSLWSPRD